MTSSDAGPLVAAAYDRAATSYSEHAAPLLYRHLGRPLADRLRGAGSVLDVATGPGTLGTQLDEVVGLDLSHELLRRNPLHRRVRADAARLPFASNSFDAAACAFGLSHVPDPSTVVAEMARVAPTVGVISFAYPALPYRPKQIVDDLLTSRTGTGRSPLGRLVDAGGPRVGTEPAVAGLFDAAQLRADVTTVEVEVPRPSTATFVAYRASMPSTPMIDLDDDLLAAAAAALGQLDPSELRWRVRLVLGIGRRALVSPPGDRPGWSGPAG